MLFPVTSAFPDASDSASSLPVEVGYPPCATISIRLLEVFALHHP